MEHEWWSYNLKLTIQKDPTETDVLILRLYQIKIETPDSDNIGKLRMVCLKAIKLDHRGENLEKYGKSERESCFNIVKKNYLESSLIGKELKGWMEAFVEEIPRWDNDRVDER